MRPIKFRAWDKNRLRMYDEPACLDATKESYLNGLVRYLQQVNLILMQYTGLKDKNGKEIYEGDIIRILYTDWPSQPPEKNGRYAMSLEDYKKSISHILVVKYFPPSFYACDFGTDAGNSLEPGRHGEREIISNIYEHPHLLEKEDE